MFGHRFTLIALPKEYWIMKTIHRDGQLTSTCRFLYILIDTLRSYPFISQSEFTNAKTKLKQVLKMNSISPFEIELSEFDVFEHTFNSIVYMKPKVVSEGQHGQDLLSVIHDLIGKTFRIQDTHEYIPHISVLYVKTVSIIMGVPKTGVCNRMTC